MPLSLSELCGIDEDKIPDLFHNSGAENNYSYSEFFSNYSHACYEFRLDLLVSWIVPIVFAFVFIIGFFGNLLVIVVVILYQQMRNTTNILILNLATADFLFILTCIPPTAVDYAIGWPLGNTWCKVNQYVIYSTTYASVYTLVLLSLDRYLAVVYPVRSISLRTVTNTTVAISTIWLFTAAICIPVYFLHGTKDIMSPSASNRTICTFERESYDERVFQGVVFVTMLALPLLLILWLYMNMLMRLWKGTAATHGPGPYRDVRNSCKGKENKLRVTRMIVVVIIVFSICWTPLQVVLLLRSLDIYDISLHGGLVILQIITHCLAYCNSCLNPILYAFLSPNFRTAYQAVSRGGISREHFSVAGANRRRSNLPQKGAEAPKRLTEPAAVEMQTLMARFDVTPSKHTQDIPREQNMMPITPECDDKLPTQTLIGNQPDNLEESHRQSGTILVVAHINSDSHHQL